MTKIPRLVRLRDDEERVDTTFQRDGVFFLEVTLFADSAKRSRRGVPCSKNVSLNVK